MKYRIYELSAKALMNYVREDEKKITFRLTENETKKCISFSAPEYQEDCALFFQTMCVLHGNDYSVPLGTQTVNDLSDIIVYIDFSGIFDRRAVQKIYTDRQRWAKAMFSPEGITLDFGKGQYRYFAFERSGSMSRNSKLSFIREDFYEKVSKRIMLDMEIGLCQLSKLYAYNGLMLTSGYRVSDMSIWDSDRIVIIDNPVTTVYEANIITLEDDGTDNAERKYHRIEKTEDIEVTEFDGEGIISKEFAKQIDEEYCGKSIHSSFQIRMPYIKGVVHSIDLKNMFAELGVPYIFDIWGKKHDINKIDLILTKSMFKGFGWMTENNIDFTEYLYRCKRYRHALYISGVNQVQRQLFTELNYQFLNTASMTADEFRPLDLPDGWEYSPEKDRRHWITKYTETAYYNLTADKQGRLNYFLDVLKEKTADAKDYLLAKILLKNPLFINEAVYTKELKDKAESILKNYSLGNLIIPGDNRYLSGDLMRLIKFLVKSVADKESRFDGVVSLIENECEKGACAYIPANSYPESETVTLLRNPHIARNEEAVVYLPESIGYLRKKYLSHLSYVVMVDSRTLIPERLGGADFDGDMVKIIADPLLNGCVRRNYKENIYDEYGYRSGIPLLKIPSATPQIRDAKDWQARFETVKSTFSTRIGQMCNAAFDRSVIAYDENSDKEERERLRAETETLEMLTGLEIDSVKSGIKPDLSEFLGQKTVNRSSFLKYKSLIENTDKEWYNPTQKQKLDLFFDSQDWENVTSNVERLPYLAKLIGEKTTEIEAVPAEDKELFTFAKKRRWKDKLKAEDLENMQAVINDYEQAIIRIRRSRHIPEDKMTRRSDIERILFSRGQENEYTADELYSLFNGFSFSDISYRVEALSEENWHFMLAEEREDFLRWFLPTGTPENLVNLFSDFRCSGYRILNDIIFDLNDAYLARQKKENQLHRDTDSKLFKLIIREYEKAENKALFKDIAATVCRQHIHFGLGEEKALMCAVALEKRQFAFEVLLDVIERYAVKRR